MSKKTYVEHHFRENYDNLVKRTIRMVPDNSRALAEEVVQEAYSRVMKYIDSYKPSLNDFEPWFNSILRNCISDCKRVERDRGVVKSEEDIEEFVQPESLSNNTIIAIKNAMEKEKPFDQKLLSLYFFEGMTTKQVGECVGRSHGAIRMFIHRFVKQFKES